MFLKKLLPFATVAMVSTAAMAWEPTGPITVTVPSSPTSLHATGFQSIEDALGVEVIYEFKPGAAGIIGTKHFLQTHPVDGHHVLLTTSISHVMGEVTNPELVTYDWENDFEFTSGLITSSIVIAVKSDTPVDNLAALVEWIRSSDKPLNVTTTFPNQIVAMNLILEAEGISKDKVNFVKYKKSAEAVKDVAAGVVEIWVGGMPPTVAFYESKDIKYVAVMSSERLPRLPNTETVNETYPGILQMSTVGALLAKGTDPEIVKWYETNLAKAVQSEKALAERDKRMINIDKAALNAKGLKAAYKANRKLLEPGYKEIFGDK